MRNRGFRSSIAEKAFWAQECDCRPRRAMRSHAGLREVLATIYYVVVNYIMLLSPLLSRLDAITSASTP